MIQGWNGNAPIFKRLINEISPKTIVEIGSWHGQSTITMATACRELGLDTKIYCIDTWLGALEFHTDPTPERDLMKKEGYPQVYYEFLKNIRNYGVESYIEPLPMTSTTGLKYLKYKGISPDIIYIDASHEYEDVKRDIELSKQLTPRVIFGDDYTNVVFPGVQQAIDEMLSNVQVIDNWFWVWYNPQYADKESKGGI